MAMRQSSVHTKDEKSALLFFFLLDTPSNNRVDIVISQGGGGNMCLLRTASGSLRCHVLGFLCRAPSGRIIDWISVVRITVERPTDL